MKGVQNFLFWLSNNWVSILVIIGLIIGIIQKTINFFSKSDKEQLEIAKSQIRAAMLKMITDAEVDYEDWNKAGSIKRSQVIDKVYDKYPILSKIADQEEIIQWIDGEINNSLKTLREIVKENQ